MSIPDATYVYEGLLCYNYFPMVRVHRDDIPPMFSTEDFTTNIADQMIQAQQSGVASNQRRGDGFDQVEYRATRFNNVLRVLHIPHPYPYAQLCRCIHDNWTDLKHICTNSHSIIKPSRHGGGRLIILQNYDTLELGRLVVMGGERFPEDVLRHITLSSGAQYFVDADVSSCFLSIYTHAIPWALVGHARAKANRSNGHWFNQLDLRQRHLKRGETQGVPIGPGTSHIISEVILSKVDDALAKKGYKFFRAIDDYKCYASTREEAECFIRDLEQELSMYLLSLNAKKVSISDLPLPSKATWITDLAARLTRDGSLTGPQIISYLDYAVTMQSRYPQGSVLKYAARTLSGRIDQANADIYVRYLLQVAYHYPVVLPVICETLQKWIFSIDRNYLREVVRRHLDFRRSDAVSWGLYLMHLAGVRVTKSLARAVVKSADCVAMATLLALGQHSDLVKGFVHGLNGAHHYDLDKYWLLIYELTRAGVFNQGDFGGYVPNTGLDILISHDVRFIHKVTLSNMKRVRIKSVEGAA